MKNTALEISSYNFTNADELLLDTSIWIPVYGPVASSSNPRTPIYSKALSDMLAASSRIYIEVLIVSEYVNRYARLRHALLKGKPGVSHDYKQFRKSAHFRPVAADIAGDVRQILKHCERIDTDFASLDITALVDEFEKADSDFNDLVLVELCKSRSLTLVTHDGDFKDCGLNVLTANKTLLS